MIEKESQQRTQKRILILCVDRDGDIEVKAGIKTPVLGRTANLDAAVSLALHDPEEPDANAMFEAVRLYDRLQAEKKSSKSQPSPGRSLEESVQTGSWLRNLAIYWVLSAPLKSFWSQTATQTRRFCRWCSQECLFHPCGE
jgi:hypothetical protein